MGGVLTFKQ